MSLKKLFSFFVLFIFICSTLLNPAMAFIEKDRIQMDEKIENVPAVSRDIENYEVVRDSAPKTQKIVEKQDAEKTVFGLMSFTYSGITVSGNITYSGTTMGLNFATVSISDKYLNSTAVPDACSITPSAGASISTGSGKNKGFYSLGSGLNVTTGNSTCNLVITASKTGYNPGELVVAIDNTTTTYSNQHIALVLNSTPSGPGFTYSGINVSGVVTRPDMTTAIANADVILGTKNYTPMAPPDNMCALSPSNQTNTTTDSNGFYSLGNNLQVTSGNSTCDLILTISKNGFVTNETTIRITNASTAYQNENRTLWMYANLTAAISTDLPNEPNTSYNQNYNSVVNVTNIGDVAANNILVELNTTSSVPSYNTTSVALLSGTSSQLVYLPVKSPNYTTTDLLVATVTGTDSVNNASLFANDSMLISTMQGAGGDDASLIVDVATNKTWPAVLNATDEAMLVNITVYNDGEASAQDAVTSFVIKNSAGEDYTSYFNSTVSAPASANITGGNNQSYTYSIWTHSAPTGNYTIYANASATDINSNSPVSSNLANTTFYVDYFAPQITITSPAEGSLTGPSALLSANTSYNTYGCYYAPNATDINQAMNQITNQTYNATLTGLANGTQTFYVECIDAWAHTNKTSITWYVDAIGPTIVLNSPNVTVIKAGDLINFTLTDETSNVSSAVYSWNGTNTTQPYLDTNQSEELIINTSSWTGNVTLHVWAFDSWNNMNNLISISGTNNTTEDINFTVDSFAPNVTINQPNATAWYGKTVPVNVSAVDDYNVSAVKARWENPANSSVYGTWAALSPVSVNGTDYWIGTVSSPHATGENWTADNYNLTIRAYAEDSVGNYNDTETVIIKIDQIPPSVNITSVPADIIGQGALFSIAANVSDIGSGIDPNANCSVFIADTYVTEIAYNATSGTCSGTITQGNSSAEGITGISIEILDNVGNKGSASATIEFEIPAKSNGGGGGGGGGGSFNETPEKLDLDFTIEPSNAKLISDEEAIFTIEIENVGEAALHNIVITTYDIAQGDYYTDPDGITIMPGQSGTLLLKITPNSLGTGIYRIDIRVGNDKYSEGGKITLDVTNATEYRAREAAIASCNAAQDNLDSLKAQGYDTDANQDTLDKAFVLIDEGSYKLASDKCAEIAAVKPGQNGLLPTVNPLTGFAIFTGKLVWSNLIWILIASGIILSAFLGRRKIAGVVAGIKKKGKGGAGAVREKSKPAAKVEKTVPVKPEAPKAPVAPKPEEKKPETPKKDDKWQIEWR